MFGNMENTGEFAEISVGRSWILEGESRAVMETPGVANGIPSQPCKTRGASVGATAEVNRSGQGSLRPPNAGCCWCASGIKDKIRAFPDANQQVGEKPWKTKCQA